MNMFRIPSARVYSVNVLCIAVLSVLTALGVGCGGKEEAPKVQRFMVTDTMMRRTRIDTVRTSHVEGAITLNGKVSADESKLVDVFPVLNGNVTSLNAELGDYVKKGQVMCVIRSPEAAGILRELNDAQSDLLIAQKNLQVQEDLFTSKLASEREVMSAKKQVQQAESNLGRLHELTTINNISERSEYTVRAPISGYVVYKAINRDMSIPQGKTDKIFTIAQLDEIWVMANVYETDIERVHEGMTASVTTLSYPDKVFSGTIDKVFNVLDPETKTMKVRIRLQNPGVMLKPEMFATVQIRYLETDMRTAVPSSCVVFDNNRNFVMVFHSRDSIETREVEVDRVVGERTWIMRGLRDGECVISQNQLYFYDALND